MNLFILLIINFNFFIKINCYDDEEYLQYYRIFRNIIFKILNNYSKSQRNIQLLNNNKNLQDVISETHPFPCNLTNPTSSKPPQSVHKLRPGDIDVIAAIGDSLTAGNGITSTNLINLLLEERGKSFSIGGESNWRQYLTLPNILKEFNPNLVGYSYNASTTIQKSSQFNVAEVGTFSSDMLYMTKILVKRIRSDKRINFENSWKMVTIMIGNNDFCYNLCKFDDPMEAVENHKIDLLRVLRYLRDNLPRTFVNIIPSPSIKILASLRFIRPHCNIIQKIQCPCIFNVLTDINIRNIYFDVMSKWQLIESEIANYNEFNNDNFTVVIQPLMINLKFPKLPNGYNDISYLSVDCFHLSQKGQSFVANELWNNLLEPVGKKVTRITKVFEKFHCPTDTHPYIFTRENSNL